MPAGREPLDGVLVVDKPVGPTSHDVVARVRRATGERRVGHTGTLDPLASGVLPLVVGRATRLARFLSSASKSYDAIVRLGITTDTDDALGRPIGGDGRRTPPPLETIEAALAAFRGTFLQRPPAYSAKHIEGRRSYAIARAQARAAERASRDVASEMPARPADVMVTVNTLEVEALDGLTLRLHVECSPGFYVRSLARDLGDRLGTGAHLTALRRTACGKFTLSDAVPLADIERGRECAAAALVPLAALLQDVDPAVLTEEGVTRARHGRELGPGECSSAPRSQAGGWVRLLDPRGDLIGLARAGAAPGALHPAVVLK